MLWIPNHIGTNNNDRFDTEAKKNTKHEQIKHKIAPSVGGL